MEKYVLTGGPGSGKSSILLGLEFMGECVIREVAEDYIRFKQAQGIAQPWTEPDFQENILRLQVQREDALQRMNPAPKLVFLDRGIPDGRAYAQKGSRADTIITNATRYGQYTGVFLVELLGSYQRTDVRRENEDEAKKIEEKLSEIYTEKGYNIKRVPAGPLHERIAHILEEIKHPHESFLRWAKESIPRC